MTSLAFPFGIVLVNDRVPCVLGCSFAVHKALQIHSAFFCSDGRASPEQIVTWFILRWNIEVTF